MGGYNTISGDSESLQTSMAPLERPCPSRIINNNIYIQAILLLPNQPQSLLLVLQIRFYRGLCQAKLYR